MKARLAASAALALGIAIGGSGCAMITYQATTEKYDPSDGISADIGTLDLRNVLVVSEDGEDGNLVMTVVNTGENDVTLGVQVADGQTLEVDILGGHLDDEVSLRDVQLEVELLFAPDGAFLDFNDRCGPVVRINDGLANLKKHESVSFRQLSGYHTEIVLGFRLPSPGGRLP